MKELCYNANVLLLKNHEGAWVNYYEWHADNKRKQNNIIADC